MAIGEILRSAREAKGWTLRDIEDGTYIKEAYLEAIEQGQYNKVPGTVYLKGFVRNYASYLGLDAGELIKQLKREIGESAAAVAMTLQNAPVKARTPSKAAVEKYRYKEKSTERSSRTRKTAPRRRTAAERRQRGGKRPLEWSEILIIAVGIIIILALAAWLAY